MVVAHVNKVGVEARELATKETLITKSSCELSPPLKELQMNWFECSTFEDGQCYYE